jgi:hypothetical protein
MRIVVGEEYKIALKSKVHNNCNNHNNNNNNKVQFMHDFFQRGRPDLLHKISRVTKVQVDQPPAHYSSEMKTLKDEIASLHQEIVHTSQQFNQQLQAVMVAVESDYQQRMNSIALSYQTLSALSGQLLATNKTTTSTKSSSSSSQPSMTTTGCYCHLPPPPLPPAEEQEDDSTPSDVMESRKTFDAKADTIPSATAAFVNNHSHYPRSFPSNVTTIPRSVTSISPSTRYVTDGSSISSREDAASEVATPPSLQQPTNCALSLLSGIATAMMEELET